MDSIKFDSISFIQIIILLMVLFAIFYIWYLQPRISRKKLKNNNEHGSSKFADIKEIKQNYDKESIDNIKSAGFPVWYEKKNNLFTNVYFDKKSPHYLLIGSTGAGKSSTVSINMGIHFATAEEKHSVILTDPKGELFRSTGKIFKDNGYEVITIDFRNPSKSYRVNIMQSVIDEWKEHCYNFNKMIFFTIQFIRNNKISLNKLQKIDKYALKIKEKYNIENYLFEMMREDHSVIKKEMFNKDFYKDIEIEGIPKEYLKYCIKKKSNDFLLDNIKYYYNLSSIHQAETNRLVISLANLIFVDENSKDPYWINASKQLFIGIAGVFLEDYRLGLITEDMISVSSIKKFQNSSLIKVNQSFIQANVNNRSYGSLSKDYLTSIFSAADNTYKSVTAIFGEKMAIYDDLNVENIISTSDFKFEEVVKKPTALYIIVPDEDKAYFQLVTVIVGMLIKSLTRYANLPENNGALPRATEWILDEFANCPPLDSIENIISVARSRKMRFFLFIQSFAQLENIYGKEISNIIQDNTALCYLKTNTVETAEVIARKLGKKTIETNSINMSTDIFKIGANQTKSLMGRELLTANEIISLKYKTIIFPTFNNPIFRDTYLYSDVYPKYKEVDIIDRESKIIKRNTENYYTVEKCRMKYANQNVSRMKKNNSRLNNKKVKESVVNGAEIKEEKKVVDDKLHIQIKNILNKKIAEELNVKENEYIFKINSLLMELERSKIYNLRSDNEVVTIGTNPNKKQSIVSVFDK